MNIQSSVNQTIGNINQAVKTAQKLNAQTAMEEAQVAAANRQQVYNNQAEVNRRWEEFRAAGGAKAAVGSDAKVMEILKQHGYYKKDGDN